MRAQEVFRLAALHMLEVALTGPGGLLKVMTKTVIEAATEKELPEEAPRV